MSEWISVDERLPLESAEVRNYQVVEVIGTDGVDVFACDFKRGNTVEDWWGFECSYDPVKVTHWMPLPEPPK